ncbi:MAG TPA: hypothetical protein VGU64_10275, partial [Terriglobales bacterium]|nr:hypothetical protein [Terriglobales bacterium]
MRCPPQGNIELMSQEEILDFKPSARPELVDDKLPKQIEDGKHCRIMRFCLIAPIRGDVIF